ncbi:uncharacterized protein K460DRAFT_400484 [Cucurbitaria berberidis CBS 394.84]|uniref:Uncharacterized protein n=1 Tax=Cucurbitaria berberidis CBS 394.84 TaxID=1168544 RepID=A0A9P4LD49_9PLEO|nr:uncharacterized protein K460DRAFT_400484 [Cucurbitaria berberidis CBS 394.84]KAF1850418.1 hypothetical protein K460DRAFT_400484 [Cucurbitaria berberidis CBS 394.84]
MKHSQAAGTPREIPDAAFITAYHAPTLHLGVTEQTHPKDDNKGYVDWKQVANLKTADRAMSVLRKIPMLAHTRTRYNDTDSEVLTHSRTYSISFGPAKNLEGTARHDSFSDESSRIKDGRCSQVTSSYDMHQEVEAFHSYTGWVRFSVAGIMPDTATCKYQLSSVASEEQRALPDKFLSFWFPESCLRPLDEASKV